MRPNAEEAWKRGDRWLRKRVRNWFRPVEVMHAMVRDVFNQYKDVVDQKTGRPLFHSAKVRLVAEGVLTCIKLGLVCDRPGAPAYMHFADDKDGIPLYKRRAGPALLNVWLTRVSLRLLGRGARVLKGQT